MNDGAQVERDSLLVELLRLQRQRRRAEWVAAFLLGVIAATGLFFAFGPPAGQGLALAQVPGGYGARGVYAFAGQITRQSYGLWMLDVDAGNLWCYELVQAPERGPRLRLVAARSWIHDRYLPEFNVAGLTPSDVARMVDELDRSLLKGEPDDRSGVGDGEPGSEARTNAREDIQRDTP